MYLDVMDEGSGELKPLAGAFGRRVGQFCAAFYAARVYMATSRGTLS